MRVVGCWLKGKAEMFIRRDFRRDAEKSARGACAPPEGLGKMLKSCAMK
jgi:hypothetical protein